MKLIFLVIFTLFSLQIFYVCADGDIANSLSVEKNTQVIEDFFNNHKANLPTDEVILVASKVIQQRDVYSKNTIAKVFILLANVANNQSDLERSFQFAHDGLMLTTIDLSLKLNLLLKVASGYYVKGQYHKVLALSNRAIDLAKKTVNTKYQLLALAYRSMANALIANYPQAFNDLKEIESIIERNQTFSENIELLEIISAAQHYLGDYQAALTINQKILKLRFDLSLKSDLVRTYYNLARSYHSLGLLDDAYNAYWETKIHAKNKSSNVYLAYAELGLGEVLLLQKNYQASYTSLVKAEQIFKEKGLTKPYISALIALAKTSLLINKTEFAHQLLMQAENMLPSIELTSDQIELYTLLSTMYQTQNNYPQALELLHRYLILNKQFIDNRLANILLRTKSLPEQDKSRQLVIKLAEKNELSIIFSKKYQQQKLMIITLSIAFSVIIILLVVLTLKQRSQQMSRAYDELERPSYLLESPIKTKQTYQLAYKQARKYNYPISVGYISIVNWKELVFRFNKKILLEVSKTIATLINEHTGEFNYAGLINDGEYLLLFPHQTSQTIENDFEKLKEALNVRFFANLGEFSVNITFALDTPSVQDIDPYIFLSKLSETASTSGSGIEYSSRSH